MSMGNTPPSGLVCPACAGRLETWRKANLLVEFCDDCSALFLDRGELFQLFRSEGYECPPEAHMRLSFEPGAGDVLDCPKCEQGRTLQPGTLQGVEIWHCTPCNGFLVERELLLGAAKARDVPLHLQGFERLDRGGAQVGDAGVSDYLSQVVQRLAAWTRIAPPGSSEVSTG